MPAQVTMQNWNDLIRTQLDNLASFPPKQTWMLGEWIGECAVRPEVANFAALPLIGNELGDVRVSLADQAWYIWDGAAWQPMGGGGGGAVNSVTASAPIASSGGANPDISLTGIVPAANGGTGIALPGALNNVLTSNGAGAWTSSAPATTSPAAPLTSVQFNNAGAFGGSAGLTWNGSTLAVDGAVDRATAGTLTVGGTTATAITVGSAGITTSFPGPVNLTGDVTTVGGTQFTTDATFDGNVTFGNAASDNISFVGQVDTAITQEGIAAPAVSPAGTGRIYFDSGTNTFKASQNGGAYVDILTGGTVTSVGASSPLSSSGGVTPSISFPSWPVNASGALTNDGAGNLTWTPASGGTITGSGTATQIAYFTGATAIGSETAVGSNSFTWDATNNRLGVGTNTPLTALDLASGQLAIPDGTAAAPALAFRDDLNTGLYSPTNDIVGVAVNGTEVARFQQSGAGSTPALLMGTSTVYGAISVDSSDASGTAGVVMLSHAAAGTTLQESYRGGQFAGVRSRGTKAAPTAVASGDGLVNMLGAGWTATAGINYGGLVALKAEQAYTATASGGRVEIHTTLNGTDGFTTLGNTATERMRIANDGRVSVGQSGGSIIPAAAGSILTLAGGLTQSAGAVSLTGNAASSLTTSAGDLTLTGGVNLQLAAGFGSAVVVNEFASNVDFRVESQANTNMLLVDASQSTVSVGTTGNTHTFNIGTGALSNFAVASGGRIHTYDGTAPTNGQVLIGDTALGNFAKAAITAGTGISVTNGAGSITIAATGTTASAFVDVPGYVAQQALNAGDLVRFVDDAGTPKVQKADATNTDARLNPVGFAVAAASAGAAVTVRVAGVADVPAARFDVAPAAADVGKRVFVSTTSGQITLTAPSASGDVLQRAGVLVDGGANPKVLVQVGDPTLL